jgi:hypothetical protein
MYIRAVASIVLVCSFFTKIAFAENISFEGIALGNEATQLIKKYRINLEDVNESNSDEGCDLIAAKRLISCVDHVAKCWTKGGTFCPPKDNCVSEYEQSTRDLEDSQCREERAQAGKINKWAANLKYAIRPKQIVCATPNTYKEVVNAYLSGNDGPLRRELGFSCRIIESITLAKIIGKSKDGKLYHVEYQVPYSDYLSDCWLSKKSLISKKEYLKSRY